MIKLFLLLFMAIFSTIKGRVHVFEEHLTDSERLCQLKREKSQICVE